MSSEQTLRSERAPGREWPVLLAVFVVGVLLILSRKPDLVTNPQFYIEDGREWYAQARELGPLHALVIPHRGYFVLVQRLGAMATLAFPLEWAPLTMALLGTALDVLPAVFVASSRFAFLVPSLRGRLLLAFLCVALPNAWTLMGSVTNAMWYLAVLACLVVLAQPSQRRSWRAFDLAAVIVSGLSGPFAVLLTPIAALKWWFRRERWTLVLLVATASAGLVQAARLLLTPKPPEGVMPLGADALKLGDLFVKRVVYEALFGQAGGAKIFLGEWGPYWTYRSVLGAVLLAGLAVVVYAMLRAPLELRLFVVYAGLTFLAAIAWPGTASGSTTWWDLLMPAGNGNRYFLTAALAFLVTCAWMATSTSLPARAAGAALLAVAAAFGVRLNWRERPYQNFDFPAAVRRYKAAPPGESVIIMTPPEWIMVLTKRADEPVTIEPEECAGDVPVSATLLVSNQMAWEGGTGRALGGDPYAIYGLPSRQFVCGVRVTFVLTTPGDVPALLQVSWAENAEAGFSTDERNSYLLVTPGPEPQTAVFHVRDTVDRIRIDPATVPGCRFRLDEVVLLTGPNGKR